MRRRMQYLFDLWWDEHSTESDSGDDFYVWLIENRCSGIADKLKLPMFDPHENDSVCRHCGIGSNYWYDGFIDNYCSEKCSQL